MVATNAICLGCDLLQPIDSTLSGARCVCGGNILPLLDEAAFRTARLAHRLGGGYYVHSAILDIVAHGDQRRPIDYGNVREVGRNDGTKSVYALDHYLREATENPETKSDLDRIWIVGALVALADAFERNNYFDRAPHLELVRHLRHGVVHGNRFRIDSPRKLGTHPANNFHAPVRSPTGSSFEITSAIQGHPVMFEFMGPGDFVDLFMSVEVYLFSLAVGNN